jgi:DNA-binding NtrC family response regulator
MSVTLLIVDDSKLARIVAAKAVAELQPDWQRIEAGSAKEALEIIDREPVDVCLLDFNMAPTNGLELAGQIHGLKPDMPIAIITANIQDEIIARSREYGAAFVPKPLTAEGLRPFVSGAVLRLRSKA